MSKRVWAGVLMGLLAAGAAAQDVKDGETLLRDAVVKKQRLLRGFNADPIVRWRWDGSSLVQEPPKLHTLGVLVANSVKVHGDKIEIDGERHTLLRSDTGLALSGVANDVRIEIDLTGADVASMLTKLMDLIFYADPQSALADLPGGYGKLLPAKATLDCCTGKAKAKVDLKRCDCASPSVADCGRDVADIGMTGMKPPSLVSAAEPQLSDEAREHKFSGNVQIGLIVDTAGKPDYLWVMKPAGMGLDAKAFEAVRQYKFKPATCHSLPVAVILYVDANFQTH